MEKVSQKTQKNTYVTVTIKKEDDKVLRLMMRRRVRFRKFREYCGKLGLEHGVVLFDDDGKRIKDLQTPDGLGLEDGDVIHAIPDQYGGVYDSFRSYLFSTKMKRYRNPNFTI